MSLVVCLGRGHLHRVTDGTTEFLKSYYIIMPDIKTHLSRSLPFISAPALRETLRLASTLLQAAGHLLISSASMIRRIIEGTELWQPQRAEYTARWN